MKFALKSSDFDKSPSDCLIVGVYENNELAPSTKKLDKLSQQYISNLLKNGDFQGKIGQTMMLFNLPNIKSPRVLLIGCGKSGSHKSGEFRKIIASALRVLKTSQFSTVFCCLTEINVEKHDTAWKIKQTVEVCSDVLYQFNEYKTKPEPKTPLETITLLIPEKNKKLEKALTQGLAVAAGVTLTKNLANQPSNVCTPAYLAKAALALAKEYKSIKVKVLEESDMKKLGMGAFLAVTQGTGHPAKLICIEYHGTSKKQAPIALVGKGITFDTGGISLKPADGMIGMKYDMSGAASVVGTLKAVAELKLPIHVVGILAAAENMPAGTAAKPEDIVTSLSGQTIEIMNTDAEGRLVLCDALTYCERYKPETVIDIATLTGAVVIALGIHATGLISNYDPLAKELLEAGIETHDRAWQMPLWDEYQEQLKSPFADMSNVGGRAGGVITAGCFLSQFAKKFHWAHLDVAGTAALMGGGADRYATGRPVPLLTQFLINRCTK